MRKQLLIQGEQAATFLQDLIDCALTPKSNEIATILATGNLAAVFYQAEGLPDRVVSWGEIVQSEYADALQKQSPNDMAALKWLRTDKPGRILLFSGDGSLCINLVIGEGYDLEPGTLDQEWMS